MAVTVSIDGVDYDVVEGDGAGPVLVEGPERVSRVLAWGTPTVTELVEPSPSYLDGLPAPGPSSPDVGGLMLAVFADPPRGLGKQKARAVVRDYPDAQLALDRGNWAVARSAVEDMLGDGAITQQQYETLQSLMAQHHIPRPAP